MPLESGTFISDLNASNPVGSTDKVQTLDDHVRLLKSTIKASFPGVTGAVTATHAELNYVAGVTSAIQTQLAGKAASSHAHSAADLTSGTIPDARFPATLPALNGSALTNLNASNLASGSVADARLSANVALKDANGTTFATTQTGGVLFGQQNLSTGTGAYGAIRALNSANAAVLAIASTAYSGAFLTNGPSGQSASLYTDAAVPLAFGVNASAALVIDTSRNFDFKGGTVTTNNASAAEVGYKGLPGNADDDNYTLVLADAGKFVRYEGGGGHTYTIPANASVAFPVGTVITIVNNSANTLTIAITSDTLRLSGTSSTGSRTVAQRGIFTAIKVNSAEWIGSGPGVG